MTRGIGRYRDGEGEDLAQQSGEGCRRRKAFADERAGGAVGDAAGAASFSALVRIVSTGRTRLADGAAPAILAVRPTC